MKYVSSTLRKRIFKTLEEKAKGPADKKLRVMLTTKDALAAVSKSNRNHKGLLVVLTN